MLKRPIRQLLDFVLRNPHISQNLCVRHYVFFGGLASSIEGPLSSADGLMRRRINCDNRIID